MYIVTLTQTRTISIPCNTDTPDDAMILIAKEYHDNHHAALATDEDWDSVEVSISCKTAHPHIHPCTKANMTDHYLVKS